MWQPIFVSRFSAAGAAGYGCTAGSDAFLFNFQFLDDEADVDVEEFPVQVRYSGGTTTPPPANIARADSGTHGHLGSMSVAVCLIASTTSFAFALDDDPGNTSNAACIEIP